MNVETVRLIASSPALIALLFAALVVVLLLAGFLVRAVLEAARRWDGRLPGASPIVSVPLPERGQQELTRACPLVGAIGLGTDRSPVRPDEARDRTWGGEAGGHSREHRVGPGRMSIGRKA